MGELYAVVCNKLNIEKMDIVQELIDNVCFMTTSDDEIQYAIGYCSALLDIKGIFPEELLFEITEGHSKFPTEISISKNKSEPQIRLKSFSDEEIKSMIG